MARLGDYIQQESHSLGSNDPQGRNLIGVSNEHGLQVSSKGTSADITRYQKVDLNWFAYNPMRINVGSIGLADAPEKCGFTSPDYTVFSCRDGLDAHYLLYFLKSEYGQEAIARHCSGAVRKRLYYSGLAEIELPIPDIDRQRSFVARYKEIQSTIHFIQNENSDKHELPLLRQAILQEAIQGKLTADWRAKNPNVEPASKLLERIKQEKQRLIAEKKLRKEKPLPPISPEGVPFEIPDSWVWCRMGDAGVLERGKSKHRPRNDQRLFEGGDIPFVQTGDVARSKQTGFRITTCTGHYNQFGLAQSRLWAAGTMCITIAANIAETGFLDFQACIPDSVVAFTSPVEGMIPEYARLYIEATRSNIERFAPATAQKNINLGILNDLMFPLPPLTEQELIIQIVSALTASVDALKSEIGSLTKRSQSLHSTVLAQIFSLASEQTQGV